MKSIKCIGFALVILLSFHYKSHSQNKETKQNLGTN